LTRLYPRVSRHNDLPDPCTLPRGTVYYVHTVSRVGKPYHKRMVVIECPTCRRIRWRRESMPGYEGNFHKCAVCCRQTLELHSNTDTLGRR
jgi:hypothetical protein